MLLGTHLGNALGSWWEPIKNLKGTCWEQRKNEKNPPPPSPPPEPSHWLHEISFSKTVSHHFWPELIPPIYTQGTYLFIWHNDSLSLFTFATQWFHLALSSTMSIPQELEKEKGKVGCLLRERNLSGHNVLVTIYNFSFLHVPQVSNAFMHAVIICAVCGLCLSSLGCMHACFRTPEWASLDPFQFF